MPKKEGAGVLPLLHPAIRLKIRQGGRSGRLKSAKIFFYSRVGRPDTPIRNDAPVSADNRKIEPDRPASEHFSPKIKKVRQCINNIGRSLRRAVESLGEENAELLQRMAVPLQWRHSSSGGRSRKRTRSRTVTVFPARRGRLWASAECTPSSSIEWPRDGPKRARPGKPGRKSKARYGRPGNCILKPAMPLWAGISVDGRRHHCVAVIATPSLQGSDARSGWFL